jgi:hypothetical protein
MSTAAGYYRYFFTFIAIVPLSSFSAEKFSGQINLWKRPVCLESKNCPLPQAFGFDLECRN